MKTRLTILLFILTPLFGCPVNQQIVQNKEIQVTGSPETAGSYYYFIEAQIQRRRGNVDKSIQFINQAIEMDPDSSFLKKELAKLYVQQKNNPRA